MNSSQSIFSQDFLSVFHLQIAFLLHSDSEEILRQLNPEDDAPPVTSISCSSDNALIFVSISDMVICRSLCIFVFFHPMSKRKQDGVLHKQFYYALYMCMLLD